MDSMSKWFVGSSRIRKFGLYANNTAKATLDFWPPDKLTIWNDKKNRINSLIQWYQLYCHLYGNFWKFETWFFKNHVSAYINQSLKMEHELAKELVTLKIPTSNSLWILYNVKKGILCEKSESVWKKLHKIFTKHDSSFRN